MHSEADHHPLHRGCDLQLTEHIICTELTDIITCTEDVRPTADRHHHLHRGCDLQLTDGER